VQRGRRRAAAAGHEAAPRLRAWPRQHRRVCGAARHARARAQARTSACPAGPPPPRGAPRTSQSSQLCCRRPPRQRTGRLAARPSQAPPRPPGPPGPPPPGTASSTRRRAPSSAALGWCSRFTTSQKSAPSRTARCGARRASCDSSRTPGGARGGGGRGEGGKGGRRGGGREPAAPRQRRFCLEGLGSGWPGKWQQQPGCG
jgi:hypothetical protein